MVKKKKKVPKSNVLSSIGQSLTAKTSVKTIPVLEVVDEGEVSAE